MYYNGTAESDVNTMIFFEELESPAPNQKRHPLPTSTKSTSPSKSSGSMSSASVIKRIPRKKVVKGKKSKSTKPSKVYKSIQSSDCEKGPAGYDETN